MKTNTRFSRPTVLAAALGMALLSGTAFSADQAPAATDTQPVPVVSSGSAVATPAGKIDKLLTEKDASATVTLAVSELFTIELGSNITTGYSWDLTTLDQKVVKMISSEYLNPSTEALGAPGKQRLTFQAVAPGSTALLLNYIQPWMKGKPAEPTPKQEKAAGFDRNDGFALSITVK